MAEHRIGRQIIEIVARDSGTAQDLAERASAVAPILAATLARRFDAAEDGQSRRIERLVLTLDACDPADFETSLVANLDAALSRDLPAQLAQVAAVDPAEDALDLIALFLRSGVLPWWAADHAALADAAETLSIAGHEGKSPSIIAALRRLLRAAGATTRLARALPPGILPRFTASLAGFPAEALDTLAVALTAEERHADPVVASIRVWATILAAVAQEPPHARLESFGEEVRARLAMIEERFPEARQSQTPAPLSVPYALATGDERSQPIRPPEADAASDLVRDAADPSQDLQAIDGTQPARPGLIPDADVDPETDRPGTISHADGLPADDGPAAPRTRRAQPPGTVSPDEAPPPSARAADPPIQNAQPQSATASPPALDTVDRAARNIAAEHDALFIEAAGIVLLAPFLADFFAAARLIDSEGRFLTPAAQHRAVVLLDYLATLDRNPPESRLALAKLLAGMPIDTVLVSGALDDGEAAAADALLDAVLAELPMLGQLTQQGFRYAWLSRPGLLTVQHGAWLLRIERRGWDMLLARLPWSMEWLQLPWQPEGIRIEW